MLAILPMAPWLGKAVLPPVSLTCSIMTIHTVTLEAGTQQVSQTHAHRPG
jgi:hypothetical protein